MNFCSFEQLLYLDVAGAWFIRKNAALLVVGNRAASFALPSAHALAASFARERLWFGLPLLTSPFPLFVGAILTERGTLLQQMALFAWLEDNYIEQPRAEVLGLTPFGEQPVVFVRDVDMDRAVEVWLRPSATQDWARLVGVIIADERLSRAEAMTADQAALALMALDLPADAQAFVSTLVSAVQRGTTLKAALRQHRKTTEPALMHRCEGWRVLARAVRVLSAAEASAATLLLEAPRGW